MLEIDEQHHDVQGEKHGIPVIDNEGYLIDPNLWNEEIAREFALQENIPLNEDHWDAINFMHEYYAEHQIAPDVRNVMKHLTE